MATSTIHIKSTANSSSSALSSVSSSTNSSSSSSPSIQQASCFAQQSSYKKPHPPKVATVDANQSSSSSFSSKNRMQQSKPQPVQAILKYDASALLNTTTASFVSSASSSCRFERNYSYIEAMRSGGSSQSNKTSLLTNSGSRISSGNADVLTGRPVANGQVAEEMVDSKNALTANFINTSNGKHAQVLPISIQTSSESNSDHLTTTSSSKRAPPVSVKSMTLNYQLPPPPPYSNMKTSQTDIHLNGDTDPVVVNGQKQSPLAKSASQSSILAIFKNTFSPFTIRKWRSKSRDKISASSSSQQQQSKLSALAAHHKAELDTNSNGKTASSSSKTARSRTAVTSNSSKYYTDTVALNGDADASTYLAQQLHQGSSKRSHNDSANITITVENGATKPISIKTSLEQRQHRDLLIDSNSSVSISSPLASSSSVSVAISPSETGVAAKSNQIEIKLIDSNNNKNSGGRRVDPADYKHFVSNSESIFTVVSRSNEKKTNSTLISANDYLDSGLYPSTKSRSQHNSLLINSPPSAAVNSNRQLSYLKLSCLVNGYDAYPYNKSPSTFETTDTSQDNQAKSTVVELVPIESSSSDLLPKPLSSSSPVPAGDHQEPKNGHQQHHHLPTPPMTPPSINLASTSPVVCDGNYFIKLLDENTTEINLLCKEYKVYLELEDQSSPDFITNEEVIGQLQTTIGKAQLLINQKFKQFRELCNKNLRDKLPDSAPSPVGEFVTRDDDLAGFWDMVCLQIDDIHKMFNLLDEIRKNKWNLLAAAASRSNSSNSDSNSTKSTNGTHPHVMKTTSTANGKKTVTPTSNLVKKRLAAENKQTPTSTITIKSPPADTPGNGLTTPTAKSTSQLKAEAARQRLMEAKKNAFKQKKEAEERLLKQEEEKQQPNATSDDNQFFSISS